MIKLYKYQNEAVEYATAMLFERNNSLIVAGTGAGKTIMMSACMGRFFKGFYSKYGRKPHILVLVHRTEIHNQNLAKFSKGCPDIATSEFTAERKSLHGFVHFGMVQTVVGQLEEFSRSKIFFDLIVIDEAHHSAADTYKQIIDWNKTQCANTFLLGVTATPNRGDKLPLIELFDNFKQIATRFLIDSHYLVRPNFIDLSPIFTVKKGVGAVQEKGYLNRNIKPDLEGRALIATLVTKYLEQKESGKSIIFVPSHEFCTLIYEELKSRGRKPAYLSLGLDQITREKELARFESGDAEELINVDIATEGYDYPPLRNVVDFDTNGTQSQWIQKVGRGLRTHEGKIGCTVIDFGGNIDLYPDGIETDVNLEGEFKKPKGEHLTEADFFRAPAAEKTILQTQLNQMRQISPYAPPKGFETVSDEDMGIVFVACAQDRDALIAAQNGKYYCFASNKTKCVLIAEDDFEHSITAAENWIKETEPNFAEMQDSYRQIGKMQIKMLAPEYSTMTLTWYGANCCICWKAWKKTIKKYFEGMGK